MIFLHFITGHSAHAYVTVGVTTIPLYKRLLETDCDAIKTQIHTILATSSEFKKARKKMRKKSTSSVCVVFACVQPPMTIDGSFARGGIPALHVPPINSCVVHFDFRSYFRIFFKSLHVTSSLRFSTNSSNPHRHNSVCTYYQVSSERR